MRAAKSFLFLFLFLSCVLLLLYLIFSQFESIVGSQEGPFKSWEELIFKLAFIRLSFSALFSLGIVVIYLCLSRIIMHKSISKKSFLSNFLILSSLIFIIIYPKKAIFKPNLLYP